MKNIITKAIGAKENLDVSVQEHELEDNDLYLLCSDGLHGMIPDRTIEEMLVASNGSLEDLVRELIQTANENGGKDNVTALALRYRK